MTDDLTTKLTEIGLTRNEALAYQTLVREASEAGLTGYEVAARSGIPRSAVYNVLRRLERAGGAFCTGEGPARYLPTRPGPFIEGMRERVNQRFHEAIDALEQLPPRATPEPVWVLSAYEDLMGRAEQLMRGSTHAIWCSLWPREASRLQAVLEDAAAGGQHVVVHCPTSLPVHPRGVSVWANVDSDDRLNWDHRILVVIDGEVALLGGAEPHNDNQAVLTRNPSLLDVAIQHLILDITLLAQRTGRAAQPDVHRMLRTSLRVPTAT